jgi:ABC-2 type transport system permease protein
VTRFVGTFGLVRLILRRDRFIIPLWLLVFTLISFVVVGAYEELYPTAEARQGFYQGPAQSPAIVALLGPAFGPDLGALVAQRLGIFFVILGLVSALAVVRHTRADEDLGRRELLGSTVVGNLAPLSAALIVSAASAIVLGILVAAALTATGLPLVGCFAVGLSLALVGSFFAAAGGAAAQIVQSAGAARALGLGVVGASFLMRALGDAGGAALTWLSWLSPIGVAQQLRPFAEERWWALLILVVESAGLAFASFWFCQRRDLGQGLLPTHPGPARAKADLRTPSALALRLQRNLIIGWTFGLGVFGLVIGSAATAAQKALEGTPQQELLAGFGGESVADSFIIAEFGFLAVLASGYAIQATLRLRKEEVELHAEHVLATSVGRTRWMRSHLAFAVLGPVFAVAAAGATAGLAYGLSTGNVMHELVRIFVAAMVQLPAIWMLASIAAVLFGFVPRMASWSWGILGLFLILGQFGVLFGFPEWVLDLSPYSHTPRVPAESIRILPAAVMVGITAGLFGAGLLGFRRRDIST